MYVLKGRFFRVQLGDVFKLVCPRQSLKLQTPTEPKTLKEAFEALLEGSWVVTSGVVISSVNIFITHIRGLITLLPLLITTGQ